MIVAGGAFALGALVGWLLSQNRAHGQEFHNIAVALARLEQLLLQLKQKEIAIMAGMDDVLTELADNTSVVESVGIGVDAAVAELDRLEQLVLAGGADPAKIQQAVDSIRASKAKLVEKRDALGAAVAAGTPAAPPTT